MRHFDARLLFPAVAATALAQQPAPAAAEAEAAVRARAQQFFQLQAEQKYRQAEALVADDTKDAYYNGNKFHIKSFTIQKIELSDDNTRAKVSIRAKVTLMIPQAGAMDFEAPSTSLWKVENGQWVWYKDPTPAEVTPFGVMKPGPTAAAPSALNTTGKAPDLGTLRTLVKIDRDSVDLTPDGPSQTVTVSNGLPGGADLELGPSRIPGLFVELEKKHLEAGEKTAIRFSAKGENKGGGVVHLMVSPLGTQLDIRVKIN